MADENIEHETGSATTSAPASYNPLALCNQLCFPLYAASRAITKRYTPLLKKLDLTYTQYITMMVLWESPAITVHELGEQLYLDSGTLTPLLKKMEAKGLLTRERDAADERKVIVSLTQKGRDLREDALAVPAAMGECVGAALPRSEAVELKQLLDKLLAGMSEQ